MKHLSYRQLVFMLLVGLVNLSGIAASEKNQEEIVINTITLDKISDKVSLQLEKNAVKILTKLEYKTLTSRIRKEIIQFYESRNVKEVDTDFIKNILIPTILHEFKITKYKIAIMPKEVNKPLNIIVEIVSASPIINKVQVKSNNIIYIPLLNQETILNVARVAGISEGFRLPLDLKIINKQLALNFNSLFTAAGSKSSIALSVKRNKNKTVDVVFNLYIKGTDKLHSTDVIIRGARKKSVDQVLEGLFPVLALESTIAPRSVTYYKTTGILLTKLKDLYIKDGYLDFSIINEEFIFSKARGKSVYLIEISEGYQYKAKQIEARDLTLNKSLALSPEEKAEIKKILDNKNYNIFNDSDQELIQKNILNILNKKDRVGNNVIITKITNDNERTLVCYFDIFAGVLKPKVDNIFIQGPDLNVIKLRQYLNIKSGDIFSFSKLEENRKQFNNLSYIKANDYEIKLKDNNTIDIIFNLITYPLSEANNLYSTADFSNKTINLLVNLSTNDLLKANIPLKVQFRTLPYSVKSIKSIFEEFEKIINKDKNIIEKIRNKIDESSLEIATNIPFSIKNPTEINLLATKKESKITLVQNIILSPKMSAKLGGSNYRKTKAEKDPFEKERKYSSVLSFKEEKLRDIGLEGSLSYNNSDALFYNASRYKTSGLETNIKSQYLIDSDVLDTSLNLQVFLSFKDNMIFDNVFKIKGVKPIFASVLPLSILQKYAYSATGYETSLAKKCNPLMGVFSDLDNDITLGSNISASNTLEMHMPVFTRSFYALETTGLKSTVVNAFLQIVAADLTNMNVSGLKVVNKTTSDSLLNKVQLSTGLYFSIMLPFVGMLSVGVAFPLTNKIMPSLYLNLGSIVN